MSSAFDDMLERNWQELDRMYDSQDGGGKSSTYRRDNVRGSTSTRSDFDTRNPDLAAPASAIVKQLNERFGSKWRYDVADRHRDGDEVIVLCKLSLLDQHVTKAQFGLARIGQAGSGSAILGSAGDVSFSLESGETAAMSGDTENAAYDRAIEDALSKCVAML